MIVANKQRWIPAYVGLGSNLDDPHAQVEKGFDALRSLPETKLVARSASWESPPMGPVEQPDFVNAVAGLLTRLSPQAMLVELKRLEEKLGRERPITRWGPRRIDFDLLVLGSIIIDDPELVLPHPGMAARPFVLLPLTEIAPDLEVPGLGKLRRLLERLDTSGVRETDSSVE